MDALVSDGATLVTDTDNPTKRSPVFAAKARRWGARGKEGPMGRHVMSYRFLLGCLTIVLMAGCRGSAAEDFSAGLVERLDDGSIAWVIRADGTVHALCKSREEKPIMAHVKGRMTTTDGASIDLSQDETSGVVEGKGLKLGNELTQAKYDLTVEDKPWTGTIFIPAGGTADLAAGASASAKIKLPEPKTGPHGGPIQVVGADVVELSANASTGELRAYLLDAQLKAVAAADREIQVGFVADGKAELVTLVLEPGGAFFTGKIGMRVDPVELTIALKTKGKAMADVALVGFQPGVALAVGAGAPRVKVMVKADIDAPAADVNARAGAAMGANVKTGLDVKAPSVSAGVTPPAAQATAGANANAGAVANAGAAANAGAGLNAGIGLGAGAKAGADTKAAAAADTSKKAQGGAKVQVKLP
jgi:hypothetical protein